MHIKKEAYLNRLSEPVDLKQSSKNVVLAFLFGGAIGLIGEIISFFYRNSFGMDNEMANSMMTITMIILAAVLSAMGIYDKIGQIGKCGLAIPITGFSNAVISSAMEYKPEGFLLGIGANAFKLAGSVLVLGVFSAAFFNFIRYTIEVLF